MASRRRRNQSIGKVLTNVERRIRKVEKRPGAKRLKTNVVTTDKILPRAIVTKKIATDAVTANEAAFGVPVVSNTQPTENVKEGTLWVNPDDGAAAVYDPGTLTFISVTDATAQSIAASKNTTYVQASEPTGGTYSIGDLWIDIDDDNKLYAWNGTAWTARRDGTIAIAQATADGKNTIYRQTSAPTGGTYVTGDLWFDTDDNNKIYRYNGTDWTTAVQLGGNALANVNANTITAGTIDASVITVSNINAGNITTGKIDAGLITMSTSPLATGNTARVEITSTGFFAYNGSVATVSITNTGTAVFSGTVNANGGTFTGYVTGGTMRFGAGVQTSKNGIYINANNYWYDTGDFQLGSGTSGVAFNSSTGALTIGSTATIAGTAASTVVSGASSGASALQPSGTLTGSVSSSATIAGTVASTVVSGAAEGATALQEGNGVTKNGSDQIVTISTASGIKVGTSPTSTGNTARVEINSGGFFAYNGSTATVQITSAGDATFSGNVTASTITGSTLKTGTSGQRIEISSSTSNYISFYGSATSDGRVSVNDHAIYMYSPASSYTAGAQLVLYGDQDAGGNTGKAILWAKSTGYAALLSATNGLFLRGDNTAVTLTNSSPVDTIGLRNIKAYASTDIFTPSTSTVGGVGDIFLVYTA